MRFSLYLRIDQHSSLYQLLYDFLQAYKHRTDVMEASTDLSIQRQIDAATSRIQTTTNATEAAVDNAKET